MADLPKRVWSGKAQVYSGKKPIWEKDGKVGVYDPNFEEVESGETYAVNKWEDLPDSAELQVYGKNSFEGTDIGTFEDGLESNYEFLNYDQTVLKSGKVKDGETPVAPADPTRAADAQYTYTFSGWNPALGPINKNTTFIAQYSTTVNTYSIQFRSGDDSTKGMLVVTGGQYPGEYSTYLIENLPYGTAITVNDNAITVGDITLTATPESGYTFGGWGEVPATVTGNTDITASFEALPPSLTPREEGEYIQQYILDNYDASDVISVLENYYDWQLNDQDPSNKPNAALYSFVYNGVTYTPTISSAFPSPGACTFVCDGIYKHAGIMYVEEDPETGDGTFQGVVVTEGFLDLEDDSGGDYSIMYLEYPDGQGGTETFPLITPMLYPMPFNSSNDETYQVRLTPDPDNESSPEKIAVEYYNTTSGQRTPVAIGNLTSFVFYFGDSMIFTEWECSTDGGTTWTTLSTATTFQANAQIMLRAVVSRGE